MNALFELFPSLRERVAWLSLAQLPTAVEDASRVLSAAGLAGELWLKRDDTSSSVYGGNKVRLLEHLLGAARKRNARYVYSSGAMGSSFAAANALHAPRVGLEPGAICFPQPLTPEAEQSHRVVSARAHVIEIPHWSLLPLASKLAERRADERGERRDRVEVLSQVSLSADALLAYASAGLELAQQVSSGACPAPARVVLPIGSAATSAGILAGLSLAHKLGLSPAAPTLCAVRIAPFPLSRRGRVLSLASRALARLSELTGNAAHALHERELLPLQLVTDQLGGGYGQPTPAGHAARQAFTDAGYPILDDTYTAKAAAHLFTPRASTGPTLFWCTKSSAPLP